MTAYYTQGADAAANRLGLTKLAGGAGPPSRIGKAVGRLMDMFKGRAPAPALPPPHTPSGPSRGHLRLVGPDEGSAPPSAQPPSSWQKFKTTPFYRHARIPLKAGIGVAQSLYTGDEQRPLSHRLADAGVAGLAGALPYTFGLGGPVLGSVARGAFTQIDPNW